MKKTFIFTSLIFYAIACIAQTDSATQPNMHAYLQLKNFLSGSPSNSASNIFLQQDFKQWLSIRSKKEFAPAILVDKDFIIQSTTTSNGKKDLIWISATKKYSYKETAQYKKMSFGEQVATDIIHSTAGSLLSKKKYHYRYSAADNNKVYTKPSFLQF
jgi:hypothetical protein